MGKSEILLKEKNKDIFLFNDDIIKVVNYGRKYPSFEFSFKADFIEKYPNSKASVILNTW